MLAAHGIDPSGAQYCSQPPCPALTPSPRHAHGSQGRHPPVKPNKPPARSPTDFTPRMPSPSTVLFLALQTEEHSTLPTFNSPSPHPLGSHARTSPLDDFPHSLDDFPHSFAVDYCAILFNMFPSSHVIVSPSCSTFIWARPFWSPCTMLFYLSGLYPYDAFLTFQCVL